MFLLHILHRQVRIPVISSLSGLWVLKPIARMRCDVVEVGGVWSTMEIHWHIIPY